MVFMAPAIHYSALEPTSSRSQQSIKHTASIRFKLSRIFKRLLSQDIHNEHKITTEIEQHIQLPKITLHLPENKEKDNDHNTLIVVKNPNTNNIGTGTSTGQESTRSMPSLIDTLERVPFTEPYFSITPKNEKFPHFELSAYHKHCIHQQKYIDQKQYHHDSSTKSSQLNPTLSSSLKDHRSDLVNCRLQNLNDQPCHQSKFNNKKSNSTTTLPVSSSLENRIGLQYASRKDTVTNSHSIRSSYAQQQTQRLRRLQNKSKVRPISSETKNSSVTQHKKSFSPSIISSSIAHRIELLKQAMHNNQLEVHHQRSEKTSSIESSFHPSIDTINKQTQTNDNQSKSSDIHHIHHHHIYSSSFLSIEWRTYLSIIGTLSIIFLLLIELTTIIF